MQIAILGPLRVTSDAGADIPVTGGRLRALLTRLALDAGADVPAAELIDALWGDEAPSNALNALQSLVSRLRRALGDPALISQARLGYRLAVAPDDVDARQFAQAVAAGRQAVEARDFAGAAALLAGAERLWRGEPLADAGDALYAAGPRARWEDLRLAAAADRIAAELELGHAAAVIGELEELAAEHPLRERFVQQLMTALAATGRTAEALIAYDALRVRLADALGTDPEPGLRALHLALLRGEGAGASAAAGEQADSAALPPARSNLRSALSSFVGRDAELDRIRAAVAGSRLATIVGPGGVGKTRLAGEAAAPLVGAADDGVWLVELAPVVDETMIPQAVLGAFGQRDARMIDRRSEVRAAASATERVIDMLVDSDAIIVLDNCEHLIGAAAEFAELLLARCPRVRVLATSREPLGLAGEAVVPIPPLIVPAADADVEEALRSPAVQLLLARGRAAQPEFAVTPETVAAVVDIVRRLDGLPLAIELAAARLRVLPVTDIAARLSDRFRLLAGGLRTSVARHRTLRAVVEWSWELLTGPERLLAERLAIFPGGATADAAREICADDGVPAAEIPGLLLALADKSLLHVARPQAGPGQQDPARPADVRFRMLETIREYGVERLDERGELAEDRGRHAGYFGRRARELVPQLRTGDQLRALDEFSAEMDNFLAALQFLGDFRPALAADLACDLCWYWTITGGHSEMVDWSRYALQATEGLDLDSRVRLQALNLVSWVTQPVQDGDTAWPDLETRVEETAAALAEIDDGSDVQTAVLRITVEFFASRGATVDELTMRGQSSDDPWLAAMAAMLRIMWLENAGDVAQLREQVDETCRAFDALGDRWGLSSVISVRAGVRALDGDTAGAIDDYLRVLVLLRELGATGEDMFVHLRLAEMYTRIGDLAAAEEQVAAVQRGRAGTPVPLERTLLAGVAEIGLLAARGDHLRAYQRSRALSRQVPRAGAVNPMIGHIEALVGTVCTLTAVKAGDLAAARDHLTAAYPATLGTRDRPIMASFALAAAGYALAIGLHADAVEILAASDVLRGAPDRGDPEAVRARAQLVDALGEAAFDAHYGAGRALDKDAAERRIDPALLG